jgi:hypothetical protein
MRLSRVLKHPPFSVFCSYSHRDESLRAELQRRLKSLERDGLIKAAWDDRRITAGQEWKGQIDRNLQVADIILLLVSWDFIASDYCMDYEMDRAMSRHESREARVIPIILRACDWQTKQFGKLQALPSDGKPIRGHSRGRDHAYLEITAGLRNVIQEMCSDPAELGAPRPDPRQTILAHLCNRSQQDAQLMSGWEAHRAARWRRPFICVIHGSKEEDLSGYFQRLLDYTFPEILGMPKDSSIRPFHKVEWPRECMDRQSFLESFARQLEGTGESTGTKRKQLHITGRPTVLYSELSNRYSNYGRQEIMQAFFEFWSQWPDLYHGETLMFVVLVSYQTGYQKILLKDLFAPSPQYANLSLVHTNQLPAVTEHDVRSWRAHQDVRRFCDVDRNMADWDNEIAHTFRDKLQIPMEQIVGTLNRMLTDYQRR